MFELNSHMMEYYEGLSDTSFYSMPHGTMTIGNFAANVYMSILSTLDSVKMLLEEA